MAWQDELRHLDEELAAGRLSAEDYRRQRDELLSRAASETDQPQQPKPAAPGAGDSPFPPPFRWNSGTPESTQVMNPIRDDAPPNSAETTQVVPGSDPAAARRAGDAERTQVVPGQHGQHPPQGPPRPPGHTVPSWQTENQSPYAPPWAGSEVGGFPQEPSWLRQGPEVFDSGSSSNTGRIVTIVAAVLVVLLGAGAIYLFAIRDTGETTPPVATSDASSTSQTPTTTTPSKPDGPFVDLDGKIIVNNTYSIEQATAADAPSKTEVQTLTQAGTEEIAGYVTEAPDGIRTGIWTFTPKDGVDPTTLLNAIDALYLQTTYQEVPGSPARVLARFLPGAADGSTLTSYRAHYLHDGVVVRVEAYGEDAAAVAQQYDELIGRQLDDFPAE